MFPQGHGLALAREIPGAQLLLLERTGHEHWLTGSRLALIAPLSAADLRIRAADLDRIKHLRDTLWAIAPAIAQDGEQRGELA